MARTFRSTALLDAPVRDGKSVRTLGRPAVSLRRTGTRTAVIAAAMSEAGL